MRTIDDVIEALGGNHGAARKMECSPSRFSQWRKRGIPRTAWPDIVKITSGVVTYKHLERIEQAL